MNCNCEQNAIVIVRNNDTDWNGANFLTINLETEILDLSNFKAVLNMSGVIKEFDDLSSGSIEVNLSAQETKNLPPFFNGVLNLIDSTNKVATIESLIPFKVISQVHGNAIATEPYTLNFDVKQGGETILTVNVESAVSVEVGTTTTLPAGSDATVTNVGTGNHLVLDFGIPQGEQGETGEAGQDGKDATINGRNAIILAAGTGIDITDNAGTVTITNTQTSAEWGNITGTLANQYDLQQALNAKQNTISDLAAIRSGAEAGATALQPTDVVNSVDDTSTNKPLSANMGKELQDQIDNLSARGRFLALWDCSTGLAETHPTVSPYEYKTGDYFIIGIVAQAGGTNYKPSGSSYVDNVPSTAVETNEVSVDDVYYYDGSTWHLQVNTQKEIAFVNIAGDPYDNTELAAALNEKQDELTQGTGINITNNTISNSGVRGVSTGATNGTISVNTNGTSAEVPVAGLGTAAYTSSTDYATAAQGDKADSAVQPSDLGTAAYASTTDFATAEQGAKADSAVQDVQINSTSILSGGVANIPKGSTGALGVVQGNTAAGINVNSAGAMNIVKAADANIEQKSSNFLPIVPTNLDKAIMEGLGNNSLTWTDAYKANARNTIGAQETLTSGTNIKTVNNNSLLGSGNLNVGYNPGEFVVSSTPLTDAGLHAIDGSVLSGDGIYGDFVGYMGGLYADDPTEYFVPNVTLVDSVTETNGVLSNFSTTSYATLPIRFNPGSSSWEMMFKFTPNIDSQERCIFSQVNNNWQGIRVTRDGNTLWYSLAGFGSTYGQTQLTSGVTYWVKMVFDGSAYTFSLSTDGETWTVDYTENNSTPITYVDTPAELGHMDVATERYWEDTIDLNGCYIKVNGSYVWQGMTLVSDIFTSEAEWQQENTTYGQCGKYVYTPASGNDPATLRIPHITYFEDTSDGAGTIYNYLCVANTTKTDIQVDIDEIVADLADKQDLLVSGTNIKTINNASLLGDGNISVQTPIDIVALSATDSITLADNTIYNGGTQTALTITLPLTVDVSFLCEIDFTSGTTATTLVYPNTIKWAGDDVASNVFVPVASKRYTIICAYDGVNWRFTVKGVE